MSERKKIAWQLLTAATVLESASYWSASTDRKLRADASPQEDDSFAAKDHYPRVLEKLYAHRDTIGDGARRGVRLDIPSAQNKKLVVVSVHEKPSGGPVIGYDHSVVVDNAKFVIQPAGQADIGAKGGNKFPMSYVSGVLSSDHATPTGVPVYYDPRVVHLYVDARNGRPLRGAKRVNHVMKHGSNLFLPHIKNIYVWAEGPDYFSADDAPPAPEGMESMVRFSEEEPPTV